MRRAKALRASQKQVAEHQYAEAFHLMQYACVKCGHEELIWNSRNGVTPFCIRCPLCGQLDMEHVNWREDETLPNYQPQPGELIFTGQPDHPKLKVVGK